MSDLIAFNGKLKTKRFYLARVRAHRKADEIIHGNYWENGKGCAEMTPDKMCIEVLRRGYVVVDVLSGTAYAKRFANKPLGSINAKGYRVCTLHLDGARRQIKLHRLVWIAAFGIPPAGMMLDHKNRRKSDNRIDNLRLVDNKGNAANRRSYQGIENPASKITQQTADAVRARYRLLKSYSKTAGEFSLSKSLVAQIVRRELWT